MNTLAKIKAMQSGRSVVATPPKTGYMSAVPERLVVAGIIGCPDGSCLDRCGKLTASHFKEPLHRKIFTAYKSLRHSPDPDHTWRDPRVIASLAGITTQALLDIGALDRPGTKFNDALQHVLHARR